MLNALRPMNERGATVVVFHGSSGSGKTVAGLLTALALPTAAVVVYCSCSSGDQDGALKQRHDRATDGAAKKQLRNELALAMVMSVVGSAIPASIRRPPVGDDSAEPEMVVVLDELGWGPDIVRGIIAVHGQLRAAIKALVHCTRDVHIVIAGTGVEGLAQDVGSSTSDYTAFRMRPRVWPTLAGRIAARIKEFVADESSPAAALIRALVTNARCAALFATESEAWHRLSGGVVTEETMAHAAARTVPNVLRDLTLPELVGAIASAMAAQLSMGDAPSLTVGMRDLKVRYGVLVDNGVLSDCRQYVTAPDGRPRYEVEPAFEAMLQFVVGMSQRPPTGEGFEQAFADFMAVALTFAGLRASEDAAGFRVAEGSPFPVPPAAAAPQDLFSRERVEYMLGRCEGLREVPRGWSAPLTCVSWLRGHLLDGRSGVGVRTQQAACKIEPGNGAMARELLKRVGAQEAAIIINGAQAEGADVIGGTLGSPAQGRKHTLTMCLMKGCLSSAPLLQHALLFELHKMGCTAEIVLAGAWAHTVKGKDLGELTTIDGVAIVDETTGSDGTQARAVRRDDLIEAIAGSMSGGMPFAQWLATRCPGLSDGVGAAQERARRSQAALSVAIVEGLGAPAGTAADDVAVSFVVAVCGDAAALSPEVARLLPDNVLLLHDAPAAANPGEAHHGQRLRGFYPVRVAHDGTAVDLSSIPAPTAPPRT